MLTVGVMGCLVLSSLYGGILTSHIASPPVEYRIQNIYELFTRFGFRYPKVLDEDKRTEHMERFAFRKMNFSEAMCTCGKTSVYAGIQKLFGNILHTADIPDITSFDGKTTRYPAIHADQLTFSPNPDRAATLLATLRTKYKNVTCNKVEEIYHKRNIVWTCEDFGCDRFLDILKSLQSNGMFVLFKNLWAFYDNRNLRWKMEGNDNIADGVFTSMQVAF